ncbi:MAG: transporter permease, putative transport system permease protein [Candidatus Saccharibacteria bacterium]|nr:transporter permease, putative transport system permease protein [Candidatus Saccharibacteria bacterium]
MNVVSRGIRNAFRNTIRTFSIVVILGLSVGLALSMLGARQAVQQKITTIKSTIGNTISISPAGARGFQGGGEPLTTAEIAKVSSIANVTKVTEALQDRLTTSDTNLVSAIDAGTLGNRQAGNSGVGFQAPPDGVPGGAAASQDGTATVKRTFTPPLIVSGVNDVSAASAYGGDSVTFTSGAAFNASSSENVAVVGKALAAKNSLSVGSTFTAYGATVKVVGIYDTGNTFANAGMLMPLATLQTLSAQAGQISSATATVNSIDNIDAATTAIKTALGTAADVTNDQTTAKTAVEPLESVKTISLYSLIGALVAGSVIILLTMMMIVRERRREIGVMKAIGSSNLKTMLQFISEAVTLTFLGMLVGLVIGIAAANPVTKVLVNNSSSSTTQTAGPGVRTRGIRGFGSNSVTNIKNIKTSVGAGTLLDGVGIAFLIAILGSAIPALLISKVRPADVMRAE